MPSFIREKKIDCGEKYKEVDIYPCFETEGQKKNRQGKRSKKVKESEPKQKNLNDKNSRRYFNQLANLNFGGEEQGLHVSVTYDNKYMPDSLEAAEKEVYNFIRRIGHKRKRQDLTPLKYILVTEYNGGGNGEDATRLHHHILMNGGLDRDEVEHLWRRKRRKGEKDGERIGFANADRIQSNDDGISALSAYLCKGISDKSGKKKKKWSSSHNLDRPTSRTNDRTYSKRQVERLANDPPPIEFWEKKYPGWTPTSPDYGVKFEFNDVTSAWSIYLKLRKKE